MSDILCKWLNEELRLSKTVERNTLSEDFSSGYLIGEVLHKYQLQDDFNMFIKINTSNSKLNNFTRIKPTLQLLGIPFDLSTAQALMQGQQGAATRLLYQLYTSLENKRKAGITGTVMETMQPAATACLHKKENEIYSDRLHMVVKRDAELELEKISQRYKERAQQWNDRSVTAQLVQEQRHIKVQEEMRIKDIEKLRASHQRQNETMACVQASIVQVPKPPPKRLLPNLGKRRQQLQRREEAQAVQAEIAQFEQSRKKSVTSVLASSSSRQSLPGDFPVSGSSQGRKVPGGQAEVMLQSNSEYIQRIRHSLVEDGEAHQERENRRRKFLVEQFKSHEAQQEALREEQLVKRLTRQTQQERRLVTQLLQIRKQKEVIRENRLFQEQQYQQRREKDFQEALEREAALARQDKLDHAEELTKQIKLRNKIDEERAQKRYKKNCKSCREVLEQIVDLATKVGEYRLLTGNLIPVKLMREWKELLFSGLPLYEQATMEGQQSKFESSTLPDPVELEKQEILNNQDYDEYINIVGEWAWPQEAGETKSPPKNNSILGHVILRLRNMVHPPTPDTPPPSPFTLKACVLGKPFSGKTTCLAKIAQVHGCHVLSADTLLQEALLAYQNEEELSIRALQGAAVEKVLRKGNAVPDELLVDILVEAIKQVPAYSGWILDGFPVNIAQAHLLEKALGGSADVEDGAADKRRRNSRTNLAGIPDATKEQPPVLALALLLDTSDECTKESVEEPAVSRSPPNSNPDPVMTTTAVTAGSGGGAADTDTGTGTDTATVAATTSPTRDKSLANAQIHQRITAFNDTWSKLAKWFGGEQSILVCLDAEVEEEELYKKVEPVLQQAIIRTQKVLDSGNAPQSSLSAPQLDQAPGLTQSYSSLNQEPALSAKSRSQSNTCSPRDHSRKMSVCSLSSEDFPCPGSVNWVYVDEPLPPEIPEHLCPYWETVCDAYVSNIKTVMQDLRQERILIIRHLYNIREEYTHYLGRPDLKQEFVSPWQKDYNSVPDDMRDNDDTKAELHQRLDDLREHLWDICDKLKEQDEQERAALMGDGWLEDHTAVLINHYSTLMQVEVDRFQDTLCILRDYYLGMYRQVLPELRSDFTCITDVPPSEKRISDIYQAALRTIVNLVLAEAQHREVEVSEKNQRQQERERMGKASATRATADQKKRKLPGKKKIPPIPTPGPSPQPIVEESPEEILKREVKTKIHEEYAAALNHEERAVQVRIELLRGRALMMVRSLQSRTEQAFGSMEKWLAARYSAEMNSIDRLAELVGHHIESGSKLQNELVLEHTDFYLNEDLRVVASLPPPPRPAALERPTHSSLTVAQLESLYQQLYNMAPSGLMPSAEFYHMLLDIISLNMGSNSLPEPWISMSETQLMEMISLLTQDREQLDWRQFLLSAALPWPIPSLTQLLVILRQFKTADTNNTGYINKEQYLQIELWSPSETVQAVPEDPSEPLPYDHQANLHKFFFQLFADHSFSPPRLDYVTMLQYLAAHPDPTQSFIRALSVVLGQHLKHPSTSCLVKSMPNMAFGSPELEGKDEEEEEEEEEEAPCGSSSLLGEQGVSIPALLTVICHKYTDTTGHNRFHPGCQKKHTEELVCIFKQLGYRPEDHVPFSVLSQSPLAQNLMEGSAHYQLVDIQRVLQVRQDEGELESLTDP
ncbi:sperm flagellar protein 2 [Diretmus argenteus]